MQKSASEAAAAEAALGAASAGLGYLLWGLSVIFYKQLMDVPPFEVLAHRSVWSVVLTLLMIVLLARHAELVAVLRDRRTMLTLLGSKAKIATPTTARPTAKICGRERRSPRKATPSSTLTSGLM